LPNGPAILQRVSATRRSPKSNRDTPRARRFCGRSRHSLEMRFQECAMPHARPRRLTKTGYLACMALSAVLIGRTAPGTLAAARTGLVTGDIGASEHPSPTAVDPSAAASVARMSAYLNSLVRYEVHVESTTD